MDTVSVACVHCPVRYAVYTLLCIADSCNSYLFSLFLPPFIRYQFEVSHCVRVCLRVCVRSNFHFPLFLFASFYFSFHVFVVVAAAVAQIIMMMIAFSHGLAATEPNLGHWTRCRVHTSEVMCIFSGVLFCLFIGIYSVPIIHLYVSATVN